MPFDAPTLCQIPADRATGEDPAFAAEEAGGAARPALSLRRRTEGCWWPPTLRVPQPSPTSTTMVAGFFSITDAPVSQFKRPKSLESSSKLRMALRGSNYQVVVAATRDMGIGKDGFFPWKLLGDLKFFKELTLTTVDTTKKNTVIMGRKTWKSIALKARSLAGRLNINFSFLPKLIFDRHEEYHYLNLVEDIIRSGAQKNDRTGTWTLSKFGCKMRFNLSNSFHCLLTKKKVFWGGVVEELVWFISGSTSAKVLQEKGIHIWDGNASREYLNSVDFAHREEGDLGPVYGFQW